MEEKCHFGCFGLKIIIMRADAAETAQLRVGNRIFTFAWVGRFVIEAWAMMHRFFGKGRQKLQNVLPISCLVIKSA